MRYAIYGIGGFGRGIAPLAQQSAEDWASASFDNYTSAPVVFVDDADDLPSHVNDIEVINFATLLTDEHKDRRILAAVGDGRVRETIEKKCENAGLTIGTLHSRTARILGPNVIGAGAVLCDSVIITSNVAIGKSFQANLRSYVEHDCVVGDYVTLAPGVHLNGNIHVEDYAYIGTGAVFRQGRPDKPLIIGEGAIVGMGAVVTKPVAPYTVVAGNPARAIKTLPRPDAAL